MLGRLFGSACTFAILWLTARHALAGDDFGRFTFYLALFALLDSLSDLGTGHVAVQQTADDPAAVPAVLAACRRIRVRAALVGVLLVTGYAWLAGERDLWALFLASLYPITNSLELSATVFKNRLSWGIPVAVRAASNAAALLAVLALVGMDVEAPAYYLLAIATTSALANVALHRLCASFLPPHTAFVAPTREVFRIALPLGIGALCQQAYFYVDNLFVRELVGEVELGHYNVAVRILSWAIMVAVYATLAALPWLTREHAAGRLGSALRRLGLPLFGGAMVVIVALMPFAEPLLGIFGEEFTAASSSLRWLLLAALTVYAGALFVTALVAIGRTRALLWISVSGLAVNLVLNALLVPRLQAEGAAMATLATEVTVAALAYLVLRSGRLS